MAIRWAKWVRTADITAHKRAEQSLLDNERFPAEAERLTAAGRMVHEINNPLAGIMGCFELVKRAVPADHEYYEYAEMIEGEIHRVGDIVHQMEKVVGGEDTLRQESSNGCPPFDVILMDMQMPVMDGDEAIRIKSNRCNGTAVTSVVTAIAAECWKLIASHCRPKRNYFN